MNWNELLKYPIIIISIFFALLGAKYFLGFDISRVTKIGVNGIEFAEQKNRTIEAIESIDQALKDVVARIDILEKAMNNPNRAIDQKEKKRILEESAQEVSSAVAQLAKPIGKGGKSSVFEKSGYIWIGDYKDKWSRPMLLGLNGQSVRKPPSDIRIGEEYAVGGNMVLRETEPKNDVEYYRDSRQIGTVTRGTRIIIEGKPKGIDREFAVQFWARIKVAE